MSDGGFAVSGLRRAAVGVALAGIAGLAAAGTTGAQASRLTIDVATIAQGPGGIGAVLGTGDFDGDGFDDFVTSRYDDQSIVVVYGSATGFDAQRTTTRAGFAFNYGAPFAVGDFDADGDDDLAVSADDYGDADSDMFGAVFVIAGTTAGLSDTDALLIELEWPNVSRTRHVSLAAGDFDADGHADLAIGVPRAAVDGNPVAGVVHVIPGSATGLDTRNMTTLHQGTPGVPGAVEEGDQFGGSLVAGDFNGDGRDDLAVGSPHEAIGLVPFAGLVHVLYGSSNGITGDRVIAFSQAAPGVAGRPERTDRFGSVLVAADTDGDGADELFVGVPDEDFEITQVQHDAGLVYMFRGGVDGIDPADNVNFHESRPGIAGVPWAGDSFGQSISLADLDRDGAQDLVIGVPGGGVGFGVPGPGSVHVLFGDGSGDFDETSDFYFSETLPALETSPARVGQFGSTITSADFDGDGFDEIVIANPRKTYDGFGYTAVVYVLETNR